MIVRSSNQERDVALSQVVIDGWGTYALLSCDHTVAWQSEILRCCRWRFHLQELSDGHWVSVARGPPENIVDAWQEFTGTLKEPIIPTSRFQVSESSVI